MAAPPRERQCGREALTKGVRVHHEGISRPATGHPDSEPSCPAAAIGSADAMKVREASLDIRTTILRPAR